MLLDKGLHLQRVTAQSQHWNQIRGRIYSKLSASKVQALTEMGLYHLTSLFLTLGVTADLSEVVSPLLPGFKPSSFFSDSFGFLQCVKKPVFFPFDLDFVLGLRTHLDSRH